MTVTSTDVAIELGRSTPPVVGSTEDIQWSQWITDVLMLIEDRLGDTADLDQTKLDYVVRKAVAAYIRWVQASVRDLVDETGRVVGQTQPGQGEIQILDQWWALLDDSTSSEVAFTITPYGAEDTSASTDLWYPIFT